MMNCDRRGVLGLWVIGLAFCAMTVTAARADESTRDPALVLHYTFDEASGDAAKDLSGYGNDGKIVNAQYVAEVEGRRGVLRFTGKGSHVNCGNAASHRFGGDMSLEMWVRITDPGASGGTLFTWGRSFYLYALPSLLAGYRSADDSVRITLAQHQEILSDRWSHLALVVEYPRMRLYHNGRLVHDAYMPIEGLIDDATAKIIGQNWAGEMDEFRLYRRALTAEEIAAHARGQSVPPGRSDELAVEAHWYEDRADVRLSCKGMNYTGHTAEVTLLRGDSTPVVAPRIVSFSESFPGSGRYVATATFPLAGLENQSLDAVARIHAPDGVRVATVYRHAQLKKPEWVHTQEGYSDDVLPPWTPVETKRRWWSGITEVKVWGRRHLFGATPFFQQIETSGTALMASPISLAAQADGAALVWKGGRSKLTHASRKAALLEQTFANDRLSLRISANLEYDGYTIFECEVAARRDTTLESLVLDLPIHTPYATLCFGSNVYPEKKDPQVPMSVLHMGAVSGDLAFRFSPSVWLGNEELGLTWQAESNEYWRYADPQRAIEILPRGDVTHFRANWVNVPTRLAAGEVLRYKFALQATPVKPLLRDAWDLRIARSDPYTGSTGNPDLNLPDRKIKLDHAKVDRIYSVVVDELNLMEDGPDRMPALDFYAETGIRHLWINCHDNWPWPLPADAVFGGALKRLINAAHAQGLKIYSYLIHERMPTNVPEYDINGLHMSNLPMTPYENTVAFCAKSQALQDAVIYNLARRMDEYGDDGIYLDGTGVHLMSCQNRAHGCGYVARPGSVHPQVAVAFDQAARGTRGSDQTIHPTYTVFALREFIRRIYTVVKQRRPDGVVDVHSWYYNSGGLAYADMLWTGEQWWHHRGKGVPYVAGELTLDAFRTAFTGIQIGVAAETLPYRLIGSSQKNSQVAATSLLHDIPVRVRTQDTEYLDIMRRLWKVRDAFGAKEAEKLFYWKNAEYVKVSPEQCYSTLLKHPRNGVLAFVTNLSREAQTVSVAFNLDALGLRGRALNVSNALTGEAVALTPDGRLSVPLGSEEWVYVWLRPEAAQ